MMTTSNMTKGFLAATATSLTLLGGGMALDMSVQKAFNNPSQYPQETLQDMQSFRTFVNKPRSGLLGLNARQSLGLAFLLSGFAAGVSYGRDNKRQASGPATPSA